MEHTPENMKKTFQRGQVSIEFLFIFMISLIYLYSVVQPGIDNAMAALDDVSRTSQAKLAAEKLAGGMNELLSAEGEAKKTIHLIVPEKTSIECITDTSDPNSPSVSFEVQLSDKLAGISHTNCAGRNCISYIALSSDSIGCPAQGYPGKRVYTVQLVKDNAGIVNAR